MGSQGLVGTLRSLCIDEGWRYSGWSGFHGGGDPCGEFGDQCDHFDCRGLLFDALGRDAPSLQTKTDRYFRDCIHLVVSYNEIHKTHIICWMLLDKSTHEHSWFFVPLLFNSLYLCQTSYAPERVISLGKWGQRVTTITLYAWQTKQEECLFVFEYIWMLFCFLITELQWLQAYRFICIFCSFLQSN